MVGVDADANSEITPYPGFHDESEFMSKRSRYTEPSPETRESALSIARGTQRPGQTKEQTKLIAQGIQKGIDQYKRQQRAKARELDRRLKQVGENAGEKHQAEREVETRLVYRQSPLPWVLLAISWIGFALFVILLFSEVDIPFSKS